MRRWWSFFTLDEFFLTKLLPTGDEEGTVTTKKKKKKFSNYKTFYARNSGDSLEKKKLQWDRPSASSFTPLRPSANNEDDFSDGSINRCFRSSYNFYFFRLV